MPFTAHTPPHILSQEATTEMTKRQTHAKTLAELPIGSAGIIYDINEKGALLRRLMDLGFSCGTAVEKQASARSATLVHIRYSAQSLLCDGRTHAKFY